MNPNPDLKSMHDPTEVRANTSESIDISTETTKVDAPKLHTSSPFEEAGKISYAMDALRSGPWKENFRPSFSEDLYKVPLASILTRLKHENLSGVLLARQGSLEISIAVALGMPISCSSTAQEALLGQRLIANGQIPRDRLEEIHTALNKSGASVGSVLLKLRILDEDKILHAVRWQATDQLKALGSWEKGRISFYPDEAVPQLTPAWLLGWGEILRHACARLDPLDLVHMKRLADPLLKLDTALVLDPDVSNIWANKQPPRPWPELLDFFTNPKDGVDLPQALKPLSDDDRCEALKILYTLHASQSLQYADGSQLPKLPMIPKIRPTVLGLPSISRADAIMGIGTSDGELEEEENSSSNSADQFAEYQKQQDLARRGRSLLRTKPYEALEAFEELVARQDKPTDALAYFAIAKLLALGSKAADEAHRLATQALANNEENALTHAALGHALQAMGKTAQATKRKAAARRLCQYNDEWASEVHRALDLIPDKASGSRQRKDSRRTHTPKTRIRPKTQIKQKAQAKNQAKSQAQGSSVQAGILIATTLIGLFVASVIFKLGTQEYGYPVDDPFFYLRRGTLLAAGLLGLKWIHGASLREAIANIGWQREPASILLAVVLGIILGVASPSQRVVSTVAIVLPLTLFHVFAEEIFFRAFIVRWLENIVHTRAVTLVQAAIFGLYHLTYTSFIFETAPSAVFQSILMITLFLGVPAGSMYRRTDSIVGPCVMHGLCNGIMMLISAL